MKKSAQEIARRTCGRGTTALNKFQPETNYFGAVNDGGWLCERWAA